MKFSVIAGLGLLLVLAGCGGESPGQGEAWAAESEDDNPDYLVLDQSLRQLRQDFNTHNGKVRLLFIVGDTCGICLRGMADLNDAFLARAQADDRLVTLVVHVPTLGAEERHVAEAIPLLDGPRITHYWDGVGKSGIHVGEALDLGGIYAWDVWLAYGPEAEWNDSVPPVPEFWMHQLGPLDDDLRLDADLFAQQALAMVQALSEDDLKESTASEATLLADGTVISSVAQPKGTAIGAHIRGVGGYQNLIRIRTIHGMGEVTAGAGSTDFKLIQDRESGLMRVYAEPQNGLPEPIGETLVGSWEMNGMLVDWKDKGHQVRISGMQKVGSSLAWKLFVSQANGMRWALYVDSHTGDIVLREYLGHDGKLVFSIRGDDFRDVDGFRFPFENQYLDEDGDWLATERFTDLGVASRGANKSKLD